MTDLASSTSVLPFLKWAGGKRWLYRDYAEHLPKEVDRYFEPFLGGGAVFLALNPPKGQLSDINTDLVNAYRAIKSDWRLVQQGLKKHQEAHNKKHYYAVRSQVHESLVERAVQFLYLNRTCWNGLYRVNLSGQFNVPKGTKSQVLLPTDDFQEIARRLRGISLRACDFEEALKDVARDDFVYIDPPYTVKHNVNGFLKYNEKIFSWNDQERLANCVARLARVGALVLVSQADHQSIKDLYRGIGNHHLVSRPSVIAADSNRRGSVTELLVRVNY